VEEIEINAFAGLQMVREIDLSYNNLQSFNPKIFSSNQVMEKVHLRGNNLVYLSSHFPILISTLVSYLDLSSMFYNCNPLWWYGFGPGSKLFILCILGLLYFSWILMLILLYCTLVHEIVQRDFPVVWPEVRGMTKLQNCWIHLWHALPYKEYKEV
jgi:hypothetical protein